MFYVLCFASVTTYILCTHLIRANGAKSFSEWFFFAVCVCYFLRKKIASESQFIAEREENKQRNNKNNESEETKLLI